MQSQNEPDCFCRACVPGRVKEQNVEMRRWCLPWISGVSPPNTVFFVNSRLTHAHRECEQLSFKILMYFKRCTGMASVGQTGTSCCYEICRNKRNNAL